MDASLVSVVRRVVRRALWDGALVEAEAASSRHLSLHLSVAMAVCRDTLICGVQTSDSVNLAASTSHRDLVQALATFDRYT